MCSAGIGKAKPSFNKTETGQCRCREGFWLDENECKMCEVSGCKNCDGDTAVCQQCFEDREEKEAADGVDCPCFSGF